ncbi:MAG: hypothetical protein M3017_18040 [Actinomycetota bacterium]|nr:hypothetical protein [Actinomycetota bacterium]
MNRHSGRLKNRPEAEIRRLLLSQEQNLIRSAGALADVLQYVDAEEIAGPQVARSVQASENRWRAMEREFGLLDSADVAEMRGARKTIGTSRTASPRRAGSSVSGAAAKSSTPGSSSMVCLEWHVLS